MGALLLYCSVSLSGLFQAIELEEPREVAPVAPVMEDTGVKAVDWSSGFDEGDLNFFARIVSMFFANTFIGMSGSTAILSEYIFAAVERAGLWL